MHPPVVRDDAAARPGRVQRNHVLVPLGAHGRHVALPRPDRPCASQRGAGRRPVVRGDDAVRCSCIDPRIGLAGDALWEPVLRRHRRQVVAPAGLGAEHRFRARPGRLRVKGRRGALARLVAPRPSRGTGAGVRLDVGGHGQPRRVRHRPRRHGPARRGADVVVAPRDGTWGALGPVRFSPLGDQQGPQTLARLFDDRQRRPDAAWCRCLGAVRLHRASDARLGGAGGRVAPRGLPCRVQGFALSLCELRPTSHRGYGPRRARRPPANGCR